MCVLFLTNSNEGIFNVENYENKSIFLSQS